MKKLSFILGLLCLFYCGLYLSGYLPASFWQDILDLFIDRPPNSYYKIVPAEGSEYSFIISLLLGIGFIVYAKWPGKQKKNPE